MKKRALCPLSGVHLTIKPNNTRKSVTLLTNNFELSVQELAEIYKRRWAIETLYKQLKQNFPLHFFYGESVNAIQIQTWVVLIANLLCTVLSRMIKRHVSFSQIVTMLRLTSCITPISSLSWRILKRMSMQFELKELNPHPQNRHYSIRACFLKMKARSPILMCFGKFSCVVSKFIGQQ